MLLLLLLIISHTQTELVWRSPKKVRWPRAHFPVMCRSSEGGPREVFQKQNAVFLTQTRAGVVNSTPKKTQAAFELSFSFRSLYITSWCLHTSSSPFSLSREHIPGNSGRKNVQLSSLRPRSELLHPRWPPQARKNDKTAERGKLTWKGLKKRHFALTFPARSKRSQKITTTMPAFTVHAAAVRWGKSPHHAARSFPQINVSWRGLNG